MGKTRKKKIKDYATQEYHHLNGELAIYRDERTQKRNWSARIKLKGGGYKTVSLKTTILTTASYRAQEIFDDIKLRERRHLPLVDPTIREIIAYWSSNDGRHLTQRRRKAVQTFFSKRVSTWIEHGLDIRPGLDARITQIKPDHLKSYASWRISTSKKTPATSTMNLEIGNWNCVIRCAKSNGLIDRDCLIPRLAKSNIHIPKKVVRPSQNTFSEEQIKALSNYIARHLLNPNSIWNKGIVAKDRDGKVRRHENGSTRSKNSMYISRVNLYASFYILLNTGMRVAELQSLRWKDIEFHQLGTAKKGYKQWVVIFRVNETKPLRKINHSTRVVVGPSRLKSHLDRIKIENPDHCNLNDFVINFQGRKRKSQQPLFEQVQAKVLKWKNKPIDCSTHKDGTTLDLRHLRSFYVSKMLLEKGIQPHILQRQTGHSLETIIKFYLTNEPAKKQKLIFGGHEIDKAFLNPDIIGM